MIPNSQPILDYWFPAGGEPPLGFTIETSEPIQILPDWLKLKMIRSFVDRLVDAALHELTPEQIILFVQNFGTPVNSMSKLLALLDLAVVEQIENVKGAILNNAYLAQLIEVQQTRGAKNGHIAVQALELSIDIIPDHPKREIDICQTINIANDTSIVPINPSQTKEIEEVLDIILQNKTVSKTLLSRFRRLIQQIIVSGSEAGNQKQQIFVTKVLQYLNRNAKSPQFFYNMAENSNVCSLFRSLFNVVQEKSSNFKYLVSIIDHAMQNVNAKNCPILHQLLNNKQKSYNKKASENKQLETQDLITVLDTSTSTDLENKGNHLLNELVKTNSKPANLADIIITTLKSSGTAKLQELLPMKNDRIGLLIDWLADLDSELVVSTRQNQLDLLFNSSLPPFRYYLLSLLSHQASWSTLYNTLIKLLSEFNPEYDPTSVLNFVAALIRNPKLSQGRDKGTPKHNNIEYVVEMNEKQVIVFSDYILSENNMDMDKLSSRVQLLLCCVASEELQLNKLVSYIRGCKRTGDVMKKQFLQQLYLNIPPMKFTVLNLNDIYLANAKDLSGCEMDKVANYTLTAISSLSVTRDFQAMSQNMELLLRKLAASHPSLLLRQISMLASLLQGRAHMDLYVLRTSHHIPLFNQVFGILEILQPLIFDEAYKDSLQRTLKCYFLLFQNHGSTKDTFNLMYRFMEFVIAYVQRDAANALQFIEPYVELIEDLAFDNRVIAPLQHLVQGVTILKRSRNPRQKKEITSDGTGSIKPEEPQTANQIIKYVDTDSTGAAAVILGPYVRNLPQNLVKLLHEVQKRTGDEVLSPLQELEIVTAKRQLELKSIFDRLLTLISSSILDIRTSAYILLIRYLKSNPGNASTNSNTLVAYVQCLRDEDSAIVVSALEYLTEMVICLQEYASEILMCTFEMGIRSKFNTFEHIRKCVLALKTQHAC